MIRKFDDSKIGGLDELKGAIFVYRAGIIFNFNENKVMSPQLSEILKLSVSERILLVEAIWDSIANETQSVKTYQLTESQIQFLEEEIVAYGKNPEEGSTWDEIKNRVLKKR